MKKEASQNIPNSLTNAYLISYNVLQFFGWIIVLTQTLSHIFANGFKTAGLWEETNICLKIFQTLALLEVVHVVIGIVRSSVVTTLIQVLSRILILWPICNTAENAHQTLGLALILIAWSVTEIIRYSFYFLNILKIAPYFLVYLRYTLFIGLYPMGVIGEQLCIVSALPEIDEKKLFTISLPNRLNFTFDFYYFCIILIGLYAPLFPKMYLHMFTQRRKIIGKESKKAK